MSDDTPRWCHAAPSPCVTLPCDAINCLCTEAREWEAYWASLTPEGRQSELRAMAAYATEADY